MVRNRLAGHAGAAARVSLRFSLFSAALLLVANVLWFAPYLVYRSNSGEFEVGLLDMLGRMLGFQVGALAFILVPGLLVSRALRSRIVAVAFVLGLLTWLQSGLLLWDYGVFDGRETDWARLDRLGWLDGLIWAVALVAAFRFSARILPAVNIVSWLLLLGQSALLGLASPQEPGFWRRALALDAPEDLVHVSTGRNIFHFVLDSFQTDVFLELVREQRATDELRGFTLFYENAGVSPHTAFAVPATLLGRTYDGRVPPSEFFRQAMAEGVQSRLFDQGYTVNLVPLLSMPESRYTHYYEIPSAYQNALRDLVRVNTAQLLDVGLFRVAPHFLRKALYDDGNWWLLARSRAVVEPATFQDEAFFTDYIERLTVSGKAPAYHFIHLDPPHPPYVTLADGSYAGRVLENTRENYLNQARVVFELMLRFVAKLEELGVYDGSLIVFQGDHGSQIAPVVDGRSITPCLTRLPAMLAVKPFGAATGALRISSAQSSLLDVAPTIIAATGGSGRSVFDLDEQAKAQRPFQVFDATGEDAKLFNYVIEGSVFDPRACRLAETLSIHLEAAAHVYGTTVQFGMAGDADAIMGSGWSSCAARHCWTNGKLAALRLKVPVSGVDHVLSLRFLPFLSEPAVVRQRVGVSVNGRLLGQWVADTPEAQTRTVRIPADLIPNENLRVELSLPDAASPAAIGAGGDKRVLGIAMLSLELERADP